MWRGDAGERWRGMVERCGGVWRGVEGCQLVGGWVVECACMAVPTTRIPIANISSASDVTSGGRPSNGSEVTAWSAVRSKQMVMSCQSEAR